MSDHHTSGAGPDTAAERTGAARLFDIRRVIGGLFVLYGAVLTAVGATDSSAEIAKAEGIRINLWTGLGMLVLGVVFLVWLRLNPAEPPAEPAEPAGRTIGEPGSAPGTGTVPAQRESRGTDTVRPD